MADTERRRTNLCEAERDWPDWICGALTGEEAAKATQDERPWSGKVQS